MKKALVLATLLLSPALAFGAGFANQSIFLSRANVTEGDTVRIHATVSNDATSTFVGNVVLQDGSAKIGSVAVTLAAGAAQTVSVSWTPTAGSHTLTAQLETNSGAVIQQTSAAFSIAEKPKPPPPPAPVSQTTSPASQSNTAAVGSSQQIQQDIAQYSPQAAQVSKPVFSVLDGFRSTAADFINSQLENAKKNLANTPAPNISVSAGSSTVPSIQTNPAGGFWYVLWTIYVYALTLLGFVINNAAVFYPVAVIIFFYILWKIFKRIRRPSY